MTDAYQALRKVEAAQKALRVALEAGCIAYANGGTGQAAPIVDDRFKGAGNQRFAPLSPDYAARKPLLLARHGKITGNIKVGKRQPRFIPGPTFQRGATSGRVGNRLIGGKALPVLVLSGKLRQAVTAGNARISVAPDGSRATITWTGLPDYAEAHANGVAPLPQRHPLRPNTADRARFVGVMRKHVAAALGITIQ